MNSDVPNDAVTEQHSWTQQEKCASWCWCVVTSSIPSKSENLKSASHKIGFCVIQKNLKRRCNHRFERKFFYKANTCTPRTAYMVHFFNTRNTPFMEYDSKSREKLKLFRLCMHS